MATTRRSRFRRLDTARTDRELAGILPASWVALEEFLVWQELHRLWEYVKAHEPSFLGSKVVSHPDPKYLEHRRSRVLLDAGPFHSLVEQRIKYYFSHVAKGLCQGPFPISQVESQITASNDGDYFKIHNDSTNANAPFRVISYVYFFYSEPKAFQGGELALYDSRIENGVAVPTKLRTRITPEQNTMVLFPSACPHEILPVSCPSGRFPDSRFTINGWLHR